MRDEVRIGTGTLVLGLAACPASSQSLRFVPLETGGCGDFGDAARDHGFLQAQIVAPRGILLRSSCFPLASLVLCELTPKEMALGAPKLQTPLSSASPREAFRIYPGFLEEYLFGELVFPVTPVGLQHAAEPFRYCLNPGLPLGAAFFFGSCSGAALRGRSARSCRGLL